MPAPTLYPFRLHIPCRIYEEMMNHARHELPNECCGLLGGHFVDDNHREGLAVKLYPLVNEVGSPIAFRTAEHASLFQAHRDMRQQQLEVLAVYHSHPTSDPIPSKSDREQWFYDSSVHLIIGLKEDSPVLRGWWLRDDRCSEAEVIVDD
jgi:proteasome lid subunit RPN8/RPN11